MTKKEFEVKYNINWHDILSDEAFRVLDELYLNYTKEELMAMMQDFYDHADEIFNSAKDEKVLPETKKDSIM